MGSDKLIKAQLGLQSVFGTPVTPTIQAPWVVDYEDNRVHHVAEWDSGTWTPTTITTLAETAASLKISGTAFFEMLPVLLNSGLEDVNGVGADPYTHTYTISPAAPAVPKPLTCLVGAVGENIGGTGPAAQLANLYLRRLRISANVNDKLATVEADLFGTGYDDNSGAGYAFASVSLPANLEAMNGLLGQINIQDAMAAGGDFATMTAFSCAWVDWVLTLETGIEPKFCLTDNTPTWIGIKTTQPSLELGATIRTTATNYALVKGKADARTYQELQLLVNGSAARKFTANLTGRWTEVLSAHSRKDGEVVMQGTFRAETPHTQTTTPHFGALIVVSKYNWGA